ncbi:MAG: alpha/beta hydrolase [Gammaproteobacteria bacterium]|nr:alpha/beta hydrolase [Gammaproteobacteria bacterium]
MKIQNTISNIVILLASLVITGCVTLPNQSVMHNHGGDISYASIGDKSPIIVFETGSGPTMSTWEPVFEKISKSTAVFAYNRPGYGISSDRNVPGSIREAARQLRENLHRTGKTSPYILVGHSYGGLIVNAFARLYPNETKAVLLIDSTHPDQTEFFQEEYPILYGVLKVSVLSSDASYEMALMDGSKSEFRNLPAFPNIPLVILTAGESSSIFESKDLRKQWIIFQRDLASMSSLSKHVIVDGSGHFIHQDKPEIVLREIKALLNDVQF